VRLRFLGTGTSFGVPVIGCRCRVCRSDDPRNRRTRHAVTLEDGSHVLLVDTPPELRLQLLREKIEDVEAAFVTHLHADHVSAMDDLRVFSLRRRDRFPVYVAREFADELYARFRYMFDVELQAPDGVTRPELELRTFEAGERVGIAGFELLPLAFPHGPTRSYGFRVGSLGFVVDAKAVPPEARDALRGVEVLVLNALWYGRPHPTHLNVEEALQVARELRAPRTYLTHLTHRLDYAGLRDKLPDGVEPAYDGLTVEFS
jgi:phosphoribosyl 1,2-cyclic phosphate phosphodiesterase